MQHDDNTLYPSTLQDLLDEHVRRDDGRSLYEWSAFVSVPNSIPHRLREGETRWLALVDIDHPGLASFVLGNPRLSRNHAWVAVRAFLRDLMFFSQEVLEELDRQFIQNLLEDLRYQAATYKRDQLMELMETCPGLLDDNDDGSPAYRLLRSVLQRDELVTVTS